MRMPKEDNIELPLLKVLKDAGGSLSIRDAIAKTKEFYPELTDEEKASIVSTGENRLNNRIAWCRQKLVDKGEIDSSTYGIWKITEKGKRRVELEWNTWKAEYIEIKEHKKRLGSLENDKQDEKFVPPIEVIGDAIGRIRESVKLQILNKLKNVDPPIFEHIVVQLLEKLGYGSFDDGTITQVGGSHDEGIDGICSLDKLGLGKVIIQAKRWNNNVGIDPVSRLVGTVHSNRANGGILITTAYFTPEAKEEAKRAGNIRLIDGEELASLMIKYELGVKTESVSYPKIDEDYFEGLG